MSQDFWTVLASLLPFAIAGAMVPSWTKYVIVLLGSKRPITNGLAFVAGNATFRLIFGVVALWLFAIEPIDAALSRAKFAAFHDVPQLFPTFLQFTGLV